MREQMLPRALDALETVLREHEPQKQGDWLERTILFHQTRAQSHLMHARNYRVNGIDPGVEIAGHTLRQHEHSALVRMAMAVELAERETGGVG